MNDTDPRLVPWAAVAADTKKWSTLSEDDRGRLGECLRDRFFALSAPGAARDGEALFRGIVQNVDSAPHAQLDGLGVSYHPSARFKALRFVDAERVGEALRPRFARPSPKMPHLAAVFVDPEELSFRSFENIIPLDRHFAASPLDISLAQRAKVGKKKADRYTFRSEVSDATRALLADLDRLELYVPPLNAVSRGGARFIFHSALLSEALGAAVKKAFPKSLLGGFSHVNPIFRCNRFEPADEKFHGHFDTPYFDAARNHVSRYTLILYLTGGRGAPALSFDDGVALDEFAELDCVVFDQRYGHEGTPYADGRKVFLRTELIFEDASIEHQPAIAELFSKACYLTGESVFAPELARHADDYYNRVAAAHWRGLDTGKTAEPFVHKRYGDVHFIANGFDFWFARDGLTIEECAAITLLDYFNCSVGGTSFHKLCQTEIVEGEGVDWIPARLRGYGTRRGPALTALDKEGLFPAPDESDGSCCPFHSLGGPYFDAARCGDILVHFERTQRFARSRVVPAPVLMMGQEVFLDPERFVVERGAVHVLSAEALSPVNFAACWNFGGSPENYIDVVAKLDVLQPLVPPILFRETEGCFHLMFDFFRNSWMVKRRQYAVPVPYIAPVNPEDAEEQGETPWSDAVDPKSIAPHPRAPKEPWWSEDTPLVRELYADADEDEDEDEDD
jgi:hypothetical protein